MINIEINIEIMDPLLYAYFAFSVIIKYCIFVLIVKQYYINHICHVILNRAEYCVKI